MIEHRHVDHARHAHGDQHVEALEAEHAPALVVARRLDPPLGERRVQVDHVRHHGGAEDAGGQQQRVGAREAGDEARGDAGGVVRHEQRVDEEAEQDHAEHPRDDDLEAAVAAALQGEQREGDHRGHQAGRQQREPEQEVERDRRADELGEVGRHGDDLGLHPEPERRALGVVLAAQLGQAAARRDADLRRQVLDQHRHQVRAEDHPQQQVAELRPAGDVGGEVARVDVRDGGHERRARRTAARAARGRARAAASGRRSPAPVHLGQPRHELWQA